MYTMTVDINGLIQAFQFNKVAWLSYYYGIVFGGLFCPCLITIVEIVLYDTYPYQK